MAADALGGFLGDLTPAEEELRSSLGAWLAEQLDGPFADLRASRAPVTDASWARSVEWEQTMTAAGWRGAAWPREVGGRGGTFREELLFELEYAGGDGPYRPSVQGERLFGPALLRLGSDELQHRFLPRILDSTEFWCQGFSEPGAGSDLAAVRTRATLVGDEWVVDGQKTWTTGAHHADWIYVLARSDPASERHRGLTMVLVPLDQPGVDVRPIVNMAGHVEFCEVFLDGARTPAPMVLGQPGEGWAAALVLLGVERGLTMLAMQLAFRRELDAGLARGGARRGDRDALVARWAELRILELLTARMLGAAVRGEPADHYGSLAKVLASRWEQAMGELGVDQLGAAGMVLDGGPDVGDHHRFFLEGRAATIYGGSDEVQHNLLAERVLGLPR